MVSNNFVYFGFNLLGEKVIIFEFLVKQKNFENRKKLVACMNKIYYFPAWYFLIYNFLLGK